ncbi:AOC03_06830 family ribosome hibernation factor [Luteimonas sp. e5]
MKSLKTVLTELRARKTNPAISILMPTHRTFPDNKQDPILLKNMVKEVEERLLAQMDKRDVWPIMEKLNAVVDAHDHNHNLDALAVFAGADGAQAVPLPFEVKQRAVIDDNFATRDLTRGLLDAANYLVVVVSRTKGRLIEGRNERPVREYDRNAKLPQHNFPLENHSLYSTSGHDRAQAQNEDNFLKEFLNRIDKGVQEAQNQRGGERLPLIVMGDARNVALYRELCDRPADIVGEVTDAPDLEADASHIIEYAQKAVDAMREKRQEEALAQIGQARGAGLLHADLSQIYRLASGGNAARLFVRRGYIQPGTMDSETLTIEPRDNAGEDGVIDDVVDELIELVGDNGGEIHFIASEAMGEDRLLLQSRY